MAMRRIITIHRAVRTRYGHRMKGRLRGLAWALGAAALGLSGPGAMAAKSNRDMGELAVKSLPVELPAFLRAPGAASDIGEFAREPDRWRNAGSMFDAQHSPEHFIALNNDGVGRTGVSVDQLPATRAEYVAMLAKAGTSEEKEGSLYYATITHFEQLKQDFGIYRVQMAALRAWKNPKERAWLRQDMVRREWLIKRDLALLVHFAGDVMAPLHVSIHKDGWSGPNPNRYTADSFHMKAEGEFYVRHVTSAGVERAMPPLRICAGDVAQCVARSLREGVTHVEPMYAMATRGGFDNANPAGVAFMTEVTARQIALARDLIVKAWRESVDQTLGYAPMLLKVSDVENGVVPTFEHLHGWD